ncbi:MAG TPA: DUF2721 domain-containing protein [Coleofasciculaceae cyanobacterium]
MEQTSQLIQLILNAVLMVMVCLLVLNGAMTRHRAVVERLRALQEASQEASVSWLDSDLNTGDRTGTHPQPHPQRFKQLKAQFPLLRRHYNLTHTSVVTALWALLCCLGSAFIMSCRTLMNWNSLISVALVLFTAGLAILLVSLGLTLLDVYGTQRSLRQELLGLLQVPIVSAPHSRGRSKPLRQIFRKISSKRRRRVLPERRSL